MAAGGGELQRAPRRVLAPDVAQIFARGGAGLPGDVHRRRRGFTEELRLHLPEMARGKQARAGRERRLGGVAGRKHEDVSCVAGVQRRGERAAGTA